MQSGGVIIFLSVQNVPSHLSIGHMVYVLIQMKEFSVASDEKKMFYCATAY